MTTQRLRTPARTPRKDKSWAYERSSFPITGGTSFKIDLLAQYKSDLGLTQLRNVTAMRIIGDIQLEELAAASTQAYVRVYVGIAWIEDRVDITMLEPWMPGTREAEWIQLGTIEGLETNGPVSQRPADARPPEACRWNVDIHQMRKQPTPNHNLLVVFKTSGLEETATLAIRYNVGVMLALP